MGTKTFIGPDVADTPLIVFINAKSGGRVGPRLLTVLFKALGQAQVVSWRRPPEGRRPRVSGRGSKAMHCCVAPRLCPPRPAIMPAFKNPHAAPAASSVWAGAYLAAAVLTMLCSPAA